MRVNDFAKQLGFSPSKVRYYDRIGLIRGDRCQGNNYREFDQYDALDIYHTQMLRSLDMSVEQTFLGKEMQLAQINEWTNQHIKELEEEIRWQEIRLQRLQEMRDYFRNAETTELSWTRYRDFSYNVFNFGARIRLDEQDKAVIRMLADVMPFSYIAIRISIESILDESRELEVSIGLGILKCNKEKLGLIFPKEIEGTSGGELHSVLFETEDPFHMKRTDVQSLLEECRRWKVQEDLVGRIYMSYFKEGRFVHCISLGISKGICEK